MISTREDWTLFRSLGTLGQKAGVPKERLASLALKELADNALDAGAVCSVQRIPNGYMVIDNGPGIDGSDEEIASLFSVRRPLTSTKLLRLPTRGALGNGLRVVTGTVLASNGWLVVETKGRRLKLTPQDDGSTAYTNEGSTPHPGTHVLIGFGPEMPLETNPTWMAERAIEMRGESWYTGNTSPHWYDSDAFYELCQAAGETSMRELASFFGVKVRHNEPNGQRLTPSLARAEVEDVLVTLRSQTKPPRVAKLGVVGEEAFRHHGYSKKTGEFQIKPAYGHCIATIPATVEAWATKIDKTDSPETYIYVNRTPISARVHSQQDSGREGRMAISGCGLNHWFKTGKSPMRIRICVTSPYMPITTDGKEPNLLPLLDVIVDAVTSATRKAKAATKEGPKASKADYIFANMQRAINVASGYGEHRFSLRQLFYAMRPLLQAEGIEEELAYGYFGTVVGNWENDAGHDVPGMYRDTRGVLYHPHTGEQIALGTLNVEKYRRPEYRFNKILYVEKGGFFPLLIDEKWAERHDCALLTSQGFASRAARDVIDLIGESEEEIEFFCVHDSDGPGSLIYEALVEGTKARQGRRVKVVNLGLDPWEGQAMGLQSESFERKRGSVPVARYIKERYWYKRQEDDTDWADWLQTNRYELNAMPSGVFLKWLDEKMGAHSKNVKVVPPREVLAAKFYDKARETIRASLIEEAIKRLDVDARVEIHMGGVEAPEELGEQVAEALMKAPAQAWESPLRALAQAEARRVL